MKSLGSGRGMLWLCGVVLGVGAVQAQQTFVLKPNMDVLRCQMPDEHDRFAGSSAPGQLFWADEPVHVRLVLRKGNQSGKVGLTIEIQEITTRDPQRRITGGEGFTDTSGHPPLFALEGKPVRHSLTVTLADEPETEVEVRDLPVPKRFGTYALVLERGGVRKFLATLCRLPRPRPGGNLDNTPIFGEFALFDNEKLYETRAACYQRMGVHGMRLETGWNEREDGSCDWGRLDRLFGAVERHGIQLMVTLGGHHGWLWPFGPHHQTPASVAPNWDGNPYWGQADWLCDPKHYPRYGRWITALCQRYWKGGRGGLWGLENYNEPWEGGGISGWARDAQQYRAIQKLIAESARKVDGRIKICAASSIMNTEDKFYADGSRDMDRYVDVFTDHYVVPSACYGPLVAKAHGKESVETETWFVGSEYLLPQIVQFLASGQKRLSPWHPRVLFDGLPGTDDKHLIPSPVVAATAALNYFITGKPFEKVVFGVAPATTTELPAAAPAATVLHREFVGHLPWVFQFGADNDPEGLLVVFGQLMPIGGDDPKEVLWPQVNAASGGTITIDNADALLKFYDLAGNPAHVGAKSVTLPLTIFPTYVTCSRGPAAAAGRLRDAKIEGRRPVEIIPHDFDFHVAALAKVQPLPENKAASATLRVTVHNCVNRELRGSLSVSAPDGWKLGPAAQEITLARGEAATLAFPVARLSPSSSGAYPLKFRFSSEAGNADWSEVLHAAVATRGAKTIDGNLDDWKDTPGVNVVAGVQAAELPELLRRPWLDLKTRKPDGNFAEFKLAWDESFLYVAARVNDKTASPPSPPMEGRDENAYFHNAESDRREPYKTFLQEKHPGRSFADVPYVYRDSPERPRSPDLPMVHFRRDRLHLALDVSDGWHDLEPTTDRVPHGLHAVPDTDYEYALYATRDGSELWRLLAPGVPRRADFPRTAKGPRSTGPVPGAKYVARRSGDTYVYEAAIPRAELEKLKLEAGTTFGLMLRAGNDDGPHVDLGADKAATKLNGLTLHPYWERSINCGVRWTLVE